MRETQLGYRNHNWELKPKDGAATALELLFGDAEGSPLTWQADVAWLMRGGAAPDVWLQRYRNRVVSAHVKDIAPAGTKLDEDGWANAGARWMVVEHDEPSDPTRCATAGFEWQSGLQV
jgi:sugar phosphate isomerase/epimerase